MQSLSAVWIIVALIAAATVILAIRSSPRRNWGFQEVLKHPKMWRDLAAADEAIDRAVEAARQWNESQVSAAVNRFVFDSKSSREAPRDARVLRALGARVHPALLEILRDASRRAELVAPTGTNLVPEAPFNRVCDLLGNTPPVDAAPLIAPFLDERANEIRKAVALVLGAIGTPAVVAPLRKVFADSDEYVRAYGLMGLQRAMASRRLDDQCALELYEDIAQLVITGKNQSESTALLLSMDQTRATGLFLSESVFTPTAPSLHKALEALADKRIAVPRDKLLGLIANLEKGEMKYPQTYALGESLRLLGQHKLAGDRSFLEERLRSSDPRVADGAAAGLIASFDLEGFEQRTWAVEGKEGFSKLKTAQKHYFAVLMYDGEVNNGGLSQYFFNSSGDHWPDALTGLEAMGFIERLAILRDAVAKFGKDGPAQDRERRQEQLAKLARMNDALFNTLDESYYKSEEAIEVLSKQYVLKNADAFR